MVWLVLGFLGWDKAEWGPLALPGTPALVPKSKPLFTLA